MTDLAIETSGLTRYFGARAVVRDLELKVPRGSVFAFLGRNGSGKTTTIRMLLGLLAPTRGASRVLGEDSATLTPQLRARVAYLTENHYVPPWMSVQELERFQASFFPAWSHDSFAAVTSYFALEPRARVKDLSRGERAGVCLALTLAQQPDLLILDDPAIGLDPVARRALLEAMLLVTRRSDHTIFFSSHQIADVERVADRIAILDRGALRVSCPLAELLARVQRWVLRFDGAARELPALPGVLQSSRSARELRVTIANPSSETEVQLTSLGAASIERPSLSLEDIVLSYLGRRGETASLLDAKEAAA